MTLPFPELDNRAWSDLADEGRSLLPRHAPAWTDHNAHDPGITLIELLAYRTELELYRLNTVTAAHRQAFLGLIGATNRPAGPRPAVTLLIYDGAFHRRTPVHTVHPGEFFVPRQTALGRAPPRRPSPIASAVDRPRVPEFGFRAAHEMTLTGFRIAAVQSFDGRAFGDLTAALSRGESALAWGENPTVSTEAQQDQHPALYIGFDLKMANVSDISRETREPRTGLTLWFLPTASPRGNVRRDVAFAHERKMPPLPAWPTEPQAPSEEVARPVVGFQPYGARAPAPGHAGLRVVWEFQSGSEWRPIGQRDGFIDETSSLTRAGRIVIPDDVLVELRGDSERVLGAVASPHSYVRCRLAHGRPDAAPRLTGVFADAVLVEQSDGTRTWLRPVSRDPSEPLLLRHLILDKEIEADIRDAADDLVRRGWGPPAAAWGAWQATDGSPGDAVVGQEWDEDSRQFADAARFVVVGIGSGDPHQTVKLPTPRKQTIFRNPPEEAPENEVPIRIITDHLTVWTLEPPWGWDPKAQGSWRRVLWKSTGDLVLCSETPGMYRFDENSNSIVFGDGERGRVPPPGAVIVASYQWTVAESANFGTGALWSRASETEPGEPGESDRPAFVPTMPFRNPIPSEGGLPAESLAGALNRLAAEFGASQQLIALAERAGVDTLDGIDLGHITPPSAVTLLDFECLARSIVGSGVARARAWVDIDPSLPGVRVPGAVTVVIVPQLPLDRPEPTRGLIKRVAAVLYAGRSIACRVNVVGPQYLDVCIRVTLHGPAGTGATMRKTAETTIRKYLHPLHGGRAEKGWPFGRSLHCGELMRVLGTTAGIKHVSGLQIAGPDGVFSETAITVPPQALLYLENLHVDIREDS